MAINDLALWIVPTMPVAAAAWLRRPKQWRFLGTTIIGLIAELVANIVALMTLFVLLAWQDGSASPDEMRAQMYGGGWMALAVIVASPFEIAVLAVAIRIVRQDFADYLALCWPRLRELVWGLAMMLALLLAWYLAAHLTDQKPSRFAVDGYRAAQHSGWLAPYLIGTCIVAPITEELLVRGFLFRGWSQSFLRPAGAIVLGSAAWALAHTQYELYFQAEIFSVGLLLGYLRHRSGSTWLTIALHVANNVAAVAWIAAVTR